MTTPINIAVIGSGYWGPNIIRNITQIGRANLHTICDLDANQLAKMDEKFHPQFITQNIADVVNNPDIEAVVVATPAHTHAEIGMQVLQAKKHLFVEKPLTLTSDDAQKLVDLAAAQGVKLMVGHVFQYNPAVRKLKELVQSGDLGEVLYIYSTRVNLGKIRDDLNAFWNLAPHDISIINYILGQDPMRVSARGFNYLQPELNLEDVVFAIVEYPNNIAAHIHTSWLDPNKIRRMTVVGEKKMVVYDDISENRITIYDKGVAWIEDSSNYGVHRLMTFSGDIYIPKLPAIEPLRAEIEHFIECVSSDMQPLSDGVDGLNVVKVLEGVSKSLASDGAIIDL